MLFEYCLFSIPLDKIGKQTKKHYITTMRLTYMKTNTTID